MCVGLWVAEFDVIGVHTGQNPCVEVCPTEEKDFLSEQGVESTILVFHNPFHASLLL